ncbi:pL11L [African swine fever virus]|uniref:PL11L n=1 Tax=African swine fever virus TaxID=10497 RepID=A0A8A1UJA6_ASF|nr:pL11L [African swine fever virus]
MFRTLILQRVITYNIITRYSIILYLCPYHGWETKISYYAKYTSYKECNCYMFMYLYFTVRIYKYVYKRNTGHYYYWLQ